MDLSTYFLARLRRLLALRAAILLKPEILPTSPALRLVNKALFSTLMDCDALGCQIEARALLDAHAAPAAPS